MQKTLLKRKELDECYYKCETYEDYVYTMHSLIKNGMSTPDYEAERWASMTTDLICQSENGLIYVQPKSLLKELMHHYTIIDQKSTLASAIVTNAPITVVASLANGLTISPDKDDILYLCAVHSKGKALSAILNFANISDSILVDSAADNLDLDDLLDSWRKWDLADPTNPRNLIYALSECRTKDALKLIENGCDVTVWRNSPMTICIEMIKKSRKAEDLIADYKKIMFEILQRS